MVFASRKRVCVLKRLLGICYIAAKASSKVNRSKNNTDMRAGLKFMKNLRFPSHTKQPQNLAANCVNCSLTYPARGLSIVILNLAHDRRQPLKLLKPPIHYRRHLRMDDGTNRGIEEFAPGVAPAMTRFLTGFQSAVNALRCNLLPILKASINMAHSHSRSVKRSKRFTGVA